MIKSIIMGGAVTPPKTVDQLFRSFMFNSDAPLGRSQYVGASIATNGGMVIVKPIKGFGSYITDTARGTSQSLYTASNAAAVSGNTVVPTADGFSIPAYGTDDISIDTCSAWTFKKAPRFFDVLTFVGNGSTQEVPHSLGQAPGMVWIKSVGSVGDWMVWHTGDDGNYFTLNDGGGAIASPNVFGNNTVSVSPGASTFTVGNDSSVNSSGSTYVAYLFGSSSSPDSHIFCGSFTTNILGNGSFTAPWDIGGFLYMPVTGGEWAWHDEDHGASEDGDRMTCDWAGITYLSGDTMVRRNSTGFNVSGHSSARKHLVMVIKRARPSGVTNSMGLLIGGSVGNPTPSGIIDTYPTTPDMIIERRLDAVDSWRMHSKLGGPSSKIVVNSAAAEVGGGKNMKMEHLAAVVDSSGSLLQTPKYAFEHETGSSAHGYGYLVFSRGISVYDNVVFTGTGANATISHGLGAAPDLWIVKNHSAAEDWVVGSRFLGANEYLLLNSSAAKATDSTMWNGVVPGASSFGVGSSAKTNGSANKMFAHLFGTNIARGGTVRQKIGTYTGNGGTLVVDCGFSIVTGSVIVKRVDAAGDWFVFLGFVGGLSPNSNSLNTNATRVNGVTSITDSGSGFTATQEGTRNLNVNGGVYLYIALGV